MRFREAAQHQEVYTYRARALVSYSDPSETFDKQANWWKVKKLDGTIDIAPIKSYTEDQHIAHWQKSFTHVLGSRRVQMSIH
ncbi:hypothetical protein L210DRAFT_3589985 [Boletus edulis BED1]|uniref:Uncharacterized protein n=1 Tax=Boletus edulis BED1 TaxID=1328754 RepID=A0AAD4B9T5_BOLED|nr:hypothetical protein L210DRAFT_3589985 [Boletus edulis BED1]